MNDSGKSFGKFLLLWSGELISAIGSGLTLFGLGVYVFEQTGKASAVALVTLLAFMPSLLLSAMAGVLVCVTSVILYNVKSIKKLENRGNLCIIE